MREGEVMGKLSAEQAKQLKDLQDLEAADDADDVVVWVRNSKGHETRLEGERALRWLKANGYDESDADESSSAEPLDSAKAGAGTAKPTKAAPKKTTGAPAGTGEAEEVTDVEDDAKPTRTGRSFF